MANGEVQSDGGGFDEKDWQTFMMIHRGMTERGVEVGTNRETRQKRPATNYFYYSDEIIYRL